jgi:hypothetical protein
VNTGLQLIVVVVPGKQYHPEVLNVNANSLSFDISSLPSGIFFAIVTSDEEIIATQKFIKQ